MSNGHGSGAFPDYQNQQEVPEYSKNEEINTLISAHLNLIGERLKEISRNIESVGSNIYTPLMPFLSKF